MERVAADKPPKSPAAKRGEAVVVSRRCVFLGLQ
jgi:hypothetical protein